MIIPTNDPIIDVYIAPLICILGISNIEDNRQTITQTEYM